MGQRLRKLWTAVLLTFTLGGPALHGPARAAEGGLPPARIAFRSYGTDLGLRTFVIEDMDQDVDGFLWIATQDGLYRYDGLRFTRFGVEDGLPTSLVTHVLAQASGRLWVGTEQGVAWNDGEGFVTVPPDAGLPRSVVNGLAITGDDRLWVALPEGLFVGDAQGRFQEVPGWPGGEATAVVGDPSQPEVVYAARGGTIGRRTAEGTWTLWDPGVATRLDSLAVDGLSRLWASSTRELVSKTPAEQEFHHWTAQVDRSASLVSRSHLALDGEGNLWIPTNAGLLFRNRDEWSLLGPEEGLPVERAQGVFHDREGSLWVWQVGGGLYRSVGWPLWDSWSRKESLPHDTVWSVHRDTTGRLWVGTEGGLARATPERWETLPAMEGVTVRTIREAADGSLWVGAMPPQIVHLEPGSGRIERFDANQGILGKKVLDVLVDDEGAVWAATVGAGVLRRGPGAARFEEVETPLDRKSLVVCFVYQDSRGRVWIGGNGGLALRNGQGWRHFTKSDGLKLDSVTQLTETPDGDFWIGYQEPVGISRIRLGDDGELRVLEHRDVTAGLSPAKVYFLGTDRQGQLWVGTGGGVDVVAGGEVRHFDTGDGLVSDDCDYMAFWADPNGDVFVGTSRGLSRFRGARDPGRYPPPEAAIVDATLGGERMSLAHPMTRRLPRGQNTLEARLGKLSFRNEARVELQVRLDGLEPEWRSVSVGEVRYPSLPPGSYLFEVRAHFGEGAWGPPDRFAFTIRPGWWETWPVRLALYVVLAGLLLAALKLRTRHLERKQRELEQVVARRTEELHEANHRLQLANDELSRLARTDALTELANRGAFDRWLAREWERARREGVAIALLLTDVDFFKRFNDTYGHPPGDECLRRIGKVVGTHAGRSTDLAARYGGEEFALILPGADLSRARKVANSLRQCVQNLAIPHSASGVSSHVTLSIGLASVVPTSERPGDLLDAADAALYRAKEDGRNRVSVAFPGEVGAEQEASRRVRSGGSASVAELRRAVAGASGAG